MSLCLLHGSPKQNVTEEHTWSAIVWICKRLTIVHASIFSIDTAFGRLADGIPEGVGDASGTVNGDGLKCKQNDGYHEQDELPGLCQKAKRDDEGCCSSGWVW
jgi:hypothetical protein